jgi:ankyrin repeat protein
MIEIRRPIGVPVVCALVAMSLQGCANIQTGRDQFRPSPMCEAMASGDVDRAIQLVKQGEDVNAASGCAIFSAVHRGQFELVKLLLDHKADPNRHVSGGLVEIMGSHTPLEAAVMSRKIPMVQMLLEGGASPRDDFNAFKWALLFRNLEMAKLLLGRGANANMPYPAENAVDAWTGPPQNQQQIEVPRRDLEPDRIDSTAKRLQCRISGNNLLFWALNAGPAFVKLLIDHGADPNAKAFDGSTPLMHAAYRHNHPAMTALMDAGADVEARDRCGGTAADYAALWPLDTYLIPQTRALLQARQRK